MAKDYEALSCFKGVFIDLTRKNNFTGMNRMDRIKTMFSECLRFTQIFADLSFFVPR